MKWKYIFQVIYIWVIEVSLDFKIAFESVEDNNGIIHNFNLCSVETIFYIFSDCHIESESQANEIKRINGRKNIDS